MSDLENDNLTEKHFSQLTKMWTETYPLVLSYVRSMVIHFDDAEDIVQQVAVTAAERFGTYDPNRPFKPWVLGIARNLVLEYYRSNKNKQVILFDNQLIDRYCAYYTEQYDPPSALVPKLEVCVSKLSSRARHLLELRYVRALSPAAIADQLGTNSGVIRVTLHRIRAALRDCITHASDSIALDKS